MPRCSAKKPDGTPCERIVPASQSHCYSHDPGRKEERRRNASRAGRSRPNRELVGIKQRLSKLSEEVLAGDVDKGVAAVASQVLNVYLRAVSVELKAREQLELIERLEVLEGAFEDAKGNSSHYGA